MAGIVRWRVVLVGPSVGVGVGRCVCGRFVKSDNVSVAFNDEIYDETRGMIAADPDTYGADRLWCMLRPIPIVLDDDDDSSEPPELPTTDDDADEDD